MDGQADQNDNKTEDKKPQIVDITPPSGFASDSGQVDQTSVTSDNDSTVLTNVEADQDVSSPQTEQVVEPTEAMSIDIATEQQESSGTDIPTETESPETETTSGGVNIQVQTEPEQDAVFKQDDSSTVTESSSVEPVVPPPPTLETDTTTEENTTGDTANDVGGAAMAAAGIAATPTSKKHVSIVPIIVALIIAVALAILTVYAYQKTKKDNADKNQEVSQSTNNPSTSAEKLQSSDVVETVEAADEALAGDDAADVGAGELGDSSLGL